MFPKRLSAFLLACCALFPLPGCETEDDRYFNSLVAERKEQLSLEEEGPWRYLGMEPQPGDDLEGEITVRAFTVNSNIPLLDTLAHEFMFRHPAVKVNVEWVVDYLDSLVTSAEKKADLNQVFEEELRLSIATGRADYIIFDNGWIDLDVAPLSTSGALEDFGPTLREDFPEGFFYEDVLEAFQVDGRQTVLPLSVSYTSIAFDREWLEKLGIDPGAVDRVSTAQVMDWYQQAWSWTRTWGSSSTARPSTRCSAWSAPPTWTWSIGPAPLTAPAFIKYLTQLTKIRNSEPLLEAEAPDLVGAYPTIDDFSVYQLYQHTGKLRGNYQYLVNDPDPLFDGLRRQMKVFTDSKPALAVLDAARPHTVLTQWQPLDYLAGPYPLTNSKGELGIVPRRAFFCPPPCRTRIWPGSSSNTAWGSGKNPDLRGGAHPLLHPYFPTNRYNLGTMAEDVTNDEGLGSTNAPFDTGIYGMDPQIYIDAVEDLFTGPLAPLEYYDQIHIQEFIDEMILHRLTTPEECAEKIQGRVTIKLNE